MLKSESQKVKNIFWNWALLPKNKNQIFFFSCFAKLNIPISILRALFDLLITHLYIGRQLCGQQLWLCSVKPSVMTKSRGTRKWRTNAVAGAAHPPAAAGIAEAGFCLLSMYTTAWQGMYYVQRIIDYHKRPHYIRPRGGSKPGRPSCQKNLYHERS